MPRDVRNLFAKLPRGGEPEEFLTLYENTSGKIERIVSHSGGSPPDFWYDQSWDEWVIVMRGSATLEFAGNGSVELNEGDYLTITKHVKHRVARTSPETVWLAVHVK